MPSVDRFPFMCLSDRFRSSASLGPLSGDLLAAQTASLDAAPYPYTPPFPSVTGGVSTSHVYRRSPPGLRPAPQGQQDRKTRRAILAHPRTRWGMFGIAVVDDAPSVHGGAQS